MSSNRLSIVASRFPEFAADLRAAQNFVVSDTHISFAKLRLILERVARTYFLSVTGQAVPEDATLQMLLDDANVKASVPPGVLDAMHAVRIPANRAIHGEVLPSIEAARGIERILDVLEWCATWWRRTPGVRARANRLVPSFQPYVSSRSRKAARADRVPVAVFGVGTVIVLAIVALISLYIASTHTAPPPPPPPPPPRYVRNYPTSWPSPIFQEEIQPGAWGSWLDEPYWRHGGGRPSSNIDRDFIWYRQGEANGVQEGNEWSIQCEEQDGTIRDVSPGHNEECEMGRRMRIRNDWHQPALVYYFVKRY